MTKEELGKALKIMLAEKQASSKELAQYICVTETYLSRIVNGHIMPSIIRINEIAEYFGFSLGDFINEVGRKNG